LGFRPPSPPTSIRKTHHATKLANANFQAAAGCDLADQYDVIPGGVKW
jgi:hypothetical protein